MSSLFLKTVKQALITFDKANAQSFTANFQALKHLADQLTIHDINLHSHLFAEETFSRPDKAPCTYVDVFQSEHFEMSVFILQENYKMPLHDHPMMHGILRGLSGSLQVNSYTKRSVSDNEPIYVKDQTEISVVAEQPKIVSKNTESVVLSPTECNFHEIQAVGGVAAFFDILGPPYDADIPDYGPRKCNFYKKYLRGSELVICKIPSPASYFCDVGYYEKPDFLQVYTDNSYHSDSSTS